MAITLVPDPLHPASSRTPAPLMIKADAMRKLYAAGTSVVDIALKYGVTYHNAYKAINPPRKRAGTPGATVQKPLTKARATQLTTKQLLKIATSKGTDEHTKKRVETAIEELDRRDPTWFERK